jgi:penicillin-binding protein 1B
MQPVPSLTLGAFELYPREVLQAYTTLANLGDHVQLRTIHRIEDSTGSSLHETGLDRENRIDVTATAELVGMMKQTIQSGSARSVLLNGFTNPAAGKTGTTNDKKDAWFAGFTPYHAAIVWVGYDDNTSHNLTGASGAVPIWTQYMKSYGVSFPAEDFAWPESTTLRDYQMEPLPNLQTQERLSATLVFRK